MMSPTGDSPSSQRGEPVGYTLALSARVPGHRNPSQDLCTSNPLARAIDQVGAWLESPSLILLAAADGYWPELRNALKDGRIAGPLVHDARVAALCRLHGVRKLWTADRDFGRFPGPTVRDPLVG